MHLSGKKKKWCRMGTDLLTEQSLVASDPPLWFKRKAWKLQLAHSTLHISKEKGHTYQCHIFRLKSMKTTEKFSYKAFTKMVIPRMIITSEDSYIYIGIQPGWKTYPPKTKRSKESPWFQKLWKNTQSSLTIKRFQWVVPFEVDLSLHFKLRLPEGVRPYTFGSTT